MYWFFLGLGIIFEVLGTISMKYADGFSKLIPSILVFIFYSLSLVSLIFVLRGNTEVSVAYAIWAGCGTALIAMIGMVWFNEPKSFIKIISIAFIIIGILGLELFE